MKKLLLILSLALSANAWAESLDGTYLCEGETHWDGTKGDDSSFMEIKGNKLKDTSVLSEQAYERIYELNDKQYDSSFKLFVSFDVVIMITKTKNKRDINVSAIEPRRHSKKNYVWQKHCKKT